MFFADFYSTKNVLRRPCQTKATAYDLFELGFNLAIAFSVAIGYDQALDLFSIAHLNTLLHLQLRPINHVVYMESYFHTCV